MQGSFFSACAFIFFVSSSASAADADWASTTTNSMNTAGNWSPSGVPASGTNLNFLSSPTQKTVNNDISDGYTTGTFTLNSSSSYTFQSTSDFLLNIGGPLTVSNSTNHTFAGSVTFSDAINLGGGTLTISGDLNGSDLTVSSGSGVILLSHASPSFSGNLSGTTTTTFRAGVADAFTSNFAISSGNVDFNSFSQTVGSITISSTNTLSTGTGNTITFNTSSVLNGTISGSATFVVADFEQLTFTGTNPSFSGNYILGAISSLRLSGSALAPSFGTGTVTLTTDSSFVQIATANSVTVPNNIAGEGYIQISTLTGNTITLSGVNTFSGGLSIFSGNLSVASTASLGSGSIFFSGANAKLIVNSSSTQTLSQPLANGGGSESGRVFEVSGGGTLILNNTETVFEGTTTIAAGTTLQLHNSVTTFGNVTNNGSFIFDTTAASSFGSLTSAISGSGSITKQNTSEMTLNGVNTYSGSTTVSGGALIMGVSGAIPTGTSLEFANTSGALLNLNNFNLSVGDLEGGGSSGGNISLGSATLTVTNSTPNSYGGSISGTGGLRLNGSSTLSLSGVQTYLGGTTIQTGTLQLNTENALVATGAVVVNGDLDLNDNDQTIGNLSGSGDISLGSAKLTVTQTSPSTFSGSIGAPSDTGSLTLAGSSILTLSAVNTYEGGTTVAGGQLAFGTANALYATGPVALTGGSLDLHNFNQEIGALSGSGNISLGSATLSINQTSDTTYSGVISGTGSVTVQGTETLILTGANTYSGITTVSGTATLQAAASSLPTPISNSASLRFNQTTAETFSHSISGSGTLYIAGSAPLTLTGSFSQQSTIVESGTLILSPSSVLSSSTITIQSGGNLGFSGNLAGNVSCSGTLLPGSGSSTLTIQENYTQAANSFCSFSVTPTTTDQLSVLGLITINSSAKAVVVPLSGKYASSQTYTLISAPNSLVSGTFNSLILVSNPFFRGTLSYNNSLSLLPVGNVQLTLEILPFSDVITGGNAGEIAHCFNVRTLPSTSPLVTLIEELILLSVPEVEKALNQIQPSQLNSLTVQQQDNLILTRSVLSQRLDELYRTSCEQTASVANPFNIWANLSADFMSQKNQQDNTGYTSKTGIVSLGIDAACFHKFFVGLAGFADYTHLDWKEDQGKASIRGFYVGPYISYFGKRTFLNLSTLASWNHYQAKRNMNYIVASQTADSTHSGFSTISHLDLGLLFYPGKTKDKEGVSLLSQESSLSLSPFVGADYLYTHENGFTETGAESLNASIDASHASAILGEAGLKIAKCSAHSHLKWIHDLKLSWIKEFRFSGGSVTGSLETTGCSFTVQGLYPNRSLLDVETGLTALFLKDHLQLSLRYEGKFGHKFNEQTGYFNGTFRF